MLLWRLQKASISTRSSRWAFESLSGPYALDGALALGVHGSRVRPGTLTCGCRRRRSDRRMRRPREGSTFEALPMRFSPTRVEVRRLTRIVGGRSLAEHARGQPPSPGGGGARERFAWSPTALGSLHKLGLRRTLVRRGSYRCLEQSGVDSSRRQRTFVNFNAVASLDWVVSSAMAGAQISSSFWWARKGTAGSVGRLGR